MNVDDSARILGSLPREKAFYFFTSIGNYTGLSASSLKEFNERLGEVNVRSLEFHLKRGDFEKWASEVLQDRELSSEIRRLSKYGFTGEPLRSQISLITSRRYKQLSAQSGHSQPK